MYQLHLLVAPGIQHVILVHFPIALFITAVALDVVGQSSKRKGMADAAYYNLLLAAISTIPVLATGILVAVQVRRRETANHSPAARGAWYHLDPDDLDGMVGESPVTPEHRGLATLSVGS